MTNNKSELVNKLLRRIFIFIVVVSLLQIPLFLIMGDTESSFDLGSTGIYYLMGASVVGIVLVAVIFFVIGPIVMQLFELRKKEKEEKEDSGMFP